MDREFFKRLASLEPTPGGGTASALAGAMAAALLSMVAKLSKESDPSAEIVSRKGEELLDDCLKLSKEDEDAFSTVVSSFKLPKQTDEEKTVRKLAIEESLKRATKVPFQTAETSLAILREAENFWRRSNKNAVSDIGVAALLAGAAAEGAIFNVLINLASLKDKTFVEEYRRKAETLRKEARTFSEKLLQKVNETLESPLRV